MFEQALKDFNTGRLHDAELLCHDILARDPSHDGSLHLLGIIALHRKKGELARDFIEQALALQPQNPGYHTSLASILNSLGRKSEAEASYREALRLDPDCREAYSGLADLFRGLGRLEEAATCFGNLVRLQPENAQAHGAFGGVLQDLKRLEEAEAQYREALRLKPNFAEVLVNLGGVLHARGRLEEAEAQYRESLRLKPTMPETHNNLGNLLRERGRPVEAEACCREALRLRPNYPSAHNNLANALRELDRYDEAESHYREAIRLKPTYPEAHNNLGTLLLDLGRRDDGKACYREALRLKPDYIEAYSNHGIALLLSGEFEEGWQQFDAHRKSANRSDLAGPRWMGEELGNRVLLIHAEQGFGDTIQFCRFVSLIGSRARVILEVPRALVALLSDLPGVERIVASGDPLPAFDLHCPLLSLPRLLGTTLETIPHRVPYLSIDPKRAAKWRDRVGALPGLRVGLAWSGNPTMAADRRRSITLDRLAVLADIPNVSFVSLQKGPAAAQTLSPPPGMVVHDWTNELHDFADTASLIAALDLVISVDTAVVHLAGALGRPVWLLNRFNSCWRWLLDRNDSPWYPSLRQFRQPTPGDWDSVLRETKAALKQKAEETRTGASLSQLLRDGVKHHRAGQFQEAEAIYHRVLAVDPSRADGLHLLGVMRLQQGQSEPAFDYITKAVGLQPRNGIYHCSLGNVLRALDRQDEAEIHYREALRLKPDYPEAQTGLGNLLLDSGRVEEAETHYREALRIKPDCERTSNNLGTLLRQAERLREAETFYRAALRLKPDFPEAHNNLGDLLRGRGQLVEAQACCREALRLKPDYPAAHNNLAHIFRDLERYDEAELHYREAVRLQPDFAEARNDLGSILVDLNRLGEAQACYRESLKLRPDLPETHCNLGIALLLDGKLAEGWQQYEWRWQMKKLAKQKRDFAQPLWTGEEIGDRVLLVHAEQGFGDAVQFSRLASVAGARARVILEVPRELVALLSDLPGVERIMAFGDPLPAFDVHCPLLSLPRLLGTTLETIPHQVPYLSIDPKRAAKWRDRVQALPGLRVGLAWSGNPAMAADRRRSITLDRLAVLADIPNVSFVSLQKGPAAAQTLSPPSGMIVHNWTDELHDFADTASLIAALDLVISVDTAVVHLAGALGRPVWLLNRFNSCWRWLLDRSDSPWYPTLRQFRQPTPGDWGSVLQETTAALKQEAAFERVFTVAAAMAPAGKPAREMMEINNNILVGA